MFTLTTEAVLLILYALRKEFPEYAVYLTKAPMIYPDAIGSIGIQNTLGVSRYVILNSRFSNSLRQYVLQSFDLQDFSSSGVGISSPKLVYGSSDYTAYIHDETDFNKILLSNVNELVDHVRKELA